MTPNDPFNILKNLNTNDYILRHRSVIIYSFIINLIAFATRLTTTSYCVDDYDFIFGNPDFLAHGRWMFHFFYHCVQGSQYIGSLAYLIGFIFMILAGLQICHYWKIKRTFSQIIIIALFSTHPYLADMYNFHVIAIPFSLGYFLGLAALNLPGNNKILCGLSTLMIAASLAFYQPIFSVICIVITIKIILLLISESINPEKHKQARNFAAQLIIIAAGVILYFTLTKIIFMITSNPVNPRFQQGLLTLDWNTLKPKIGWTLITLTNKILPFPEAAIRTPAKIIMFGIATIAFSLSLYRTYKIKYAICYRIMLAILFLAAPAISIIHILPLTSMALPWRASLGLVVLFAGCYAIILSCSNTKIIRIIHGLMIIVITHFIIQNNALFFKQYLCTQQDLALANRIVERIESMEQYQNGLKLVIVGDLAPQKFHKEGKNTYQIIKEYLKISSQKSYSIGSSAFHTPWSKYSILLDMLMLQLELPENKDIYLAQEITKKRKPFPYPESIFIHDDMVIVLLDHPK